MPSCQLTRATRGVCHSVGKDLQLQDPQKCSSSSSVAGLPLTKTLGRMSVPERESYCQHTAAETRNLPKPRPGWRSNLPWIRRRKNKARPRQPHEEFPREQEGCMCPTARCNLAREQQKNGHSWWPLPKPSKTERSATWGGQDLVHLDALRGLLLDPIFNWESLVSSWALKSLRTRYLPRLSCWKRGLHSGRQQYHSVSATVLSMRFGRGL